MSARSKAYWDANAGAFAFSHALEPTWLAEIPKDARIVDYGCGYGRTLTELARGGWRNTLGVDFSGEMIARGRAEHPDLVLRHIEATRSAEPDGAFEAAILFAVLTSIPDDAEQLAVMAELRRLLRLGGLLYLSDYGLQAGPRYAERYRLGLERHGMLGVWDREDGGVFRHHTPERLAELMAGFDVVAERKVDSVTMSGAPAVVTQLLGRRR